MPTNLSVTGTPGSGPYAGAPPTGFTVLAPGSVAAPDADAVIVAAAPPVRTTAARIANERRAERCERAPARRGEGAADFGALLAIPASAVVRVSKWSSASDARSSGFGPWAMASSWDTN